MNNKITIVLISHKSRELILKFINNLSKNIQILVIENSYDIDKKEKYQARLNGLISSIRGLKSFKRL